MQFREALAALVLVAAPAACDSGAAERVEAQRLIASYEALTAAVGTDGRKSRLQALEALPLRSQVPSKARDLCVEAHGSLLQAEAEQERAAEMLEEAITGRGAEPLPLDRVQPIQQSLDRSEKALAAARKRFVECEDAVRDLALRYGQRR